MAAFNSTTGAVVIDFSAARQARRTASRPFQGRLLKTAVAGMDGTQRAVLRAAVADGFARGLTTQDIVRSIRRDNVRQAARAAL